MGIVTHEAVTLRTRNAEETRTVGRLLAGVLRAGDVVVLSGELGAGKTTLTQGIGVGLGVGEPVTSPTFVLSRVHRPGTGGPPLVHVDAYRLSGAGELDDLDLEETLATAVTVVEWGEGLADVLSPDRLRIHLARHGAALDEGPDELRRIRVTSVGRRWSDVRLRQVLQPALG